MIPKLAPKQKEYANNANSRWNFKTGAVRSGKSYCDIACVVPDRILSRKGKSGLSVILGVSKSTVERNVLQPMREIYGAKRIGIINSQNIARLFGEQVYCLGAEKVSQVAKIQGASIKYAYGDEVAKWNPEVFEMLKSRLDKAYSCFDGSCNPEHPTHWLKTFLDSDADIYQQHYTIFDNTYLPKEFVENLCKEYAGTIYYDRLIEGLWKRADGAIYRRFADHPEAFIVAPKAVKQVTDIRVGVDFGGNQSGHAFVATGIVGDYEGVTALMSRRIMAKDTDTPIDSNMLDKLVLQFIADVQAKYGRVSSLYWDNAETVLGNSIRNAVERDCPDIGVYPAAKRRINDRINATVRLQGGGRFWMTTDCATLKDAMTEAVWNREKQDDERLDDGSTDIDSLDAFEYTIEQDISYLIGA
jgi:PBSX family phage terminase large subunit